MMSEFIKCDDIIKIYPQPRGIDTFGTLRGVSFSASRGDFISIVGPSGVGKSTLLNILAGELEPSAGVVAIDNKNMNSFTRRQLIGYRQSTMGIMFQNPRMNLIWNLNVFENIMLPISVSHKAKNKDIAKDKVEKLLQDFGIKTKMRSKISHLSGGELQRVGLAIALANNPSLLLLDEPTSQLDAFSTMNIIKYLKNLCKKQKKLIIMVTHNLRITKEADKTYIMRKGQLTEMETGTKETHLK